MASTKTPTKIPNPAEVPPTEPLNGDLLYNLCLAFNVMMKNGTTLVKDKARVCNDLAQIVRAKPQRFVVKTLDDLMEVLKLDLSKRKITHLALKHSALKETDLIYNGSYMSIYAEDVSTSFIGISECKMDSLVDLTHLEIAFEHEVNYPPNISHLRTAGKFRRTSKNFPSTLTYLTIGELFDQPLDNLHEGLLHLETNSIANHPLDKLPSTLQTLNTGHNFNHPIDKLPITLTHLVLGNRFNQLIGDSLKRLVNLETLVIGWEFNQVIDSYPPNLKKLVFNSRYDFPLSGLPSTLKSLKLPFGFNQPLPDLSDLPSTLLKLIFGYEFNQEITSLPPSIEKLIFGSEFNKPIDFIKGLINLRFLKFGNDFNKPIDAIAGLSKLVSLEFGDRFNQPIRPTLDQPIQPQPQSHPQSHPLPSQPIHYSYNHPRNRSHSRSRGYQPKPRTLMCRPVAPPPPNHFLPLSLQTLVFGRDFNQSITFIERLVNLLSLGFGFMFNQPILAPPLLQRLMIGQKVFYEFSKKSVKY